MGKDQEISTLYKELQIVKECRVGETAFPREKHANWLSIQLVSSENIQVALYRFSRLYLEIIYTHTYILQALYTYMHVKTINEKELMNLKESKERYMYLKGGKRKDKQC